MSDTKTELLKQLQNFSGLGKGLLTTEEAREFCDNSRGRITTISIWTKDDDRYWFYSSDHLFGYKVLSSSWVPGSSTLPMYVTKREGLEDGVISTVEQYAFVFHSSKEHQITTLEELVDLEIRLNEENLKFERDLKEKELKHWNRLKKYNASFFPEGTVVKVSNYLSDREGDLYTVDSVMPRGPRNILLQMKETQLLTDPFSGKPSVSLHVFNSCHVTEIVKRGRGRVNIEEYSSWNLELEKYYVDGQHDVRSKGSYRYKPFDIAYHLIFGLKLPYDQYVDIDRLAYELNKALGKRKLGSDVVTFHKKKCKQWVKRNYSKFLMSNKALYKDYLEEQKALDDIMND